MAMFIGFDPGAKGAMAIIYMDNSIEIIDFDTHGLTGYLDELRTAMIGDDTTILAGIEWATAMPKQGVRSMFNFGQRFGELQGMLAGLEIGYTLVRPRSWQAACAVKAKSGKKGVYTAIKMLYPTAELLGPRGAIKDGRCDALGVAHYIRKTYG